MQIPKLILRKSAAEPVVNEERLLARYRQIMIFIGLLYPIWRFTSFYINGDHVESWAERGLVGLLFLVATLLTYVHDYFRKHVEAVFDVVAGIWTLQVFLLIWRSELDSDFIQMGLITIFCVGGSFLNRRGMLKYYLLCLILIGYTFYLFPGQDSSTFFFGVLTALAVSYVCFMTLITVFRDLQQSQETLAKRTQEFEELSAAVQSLFLPNSTYVKERGFELAGYYRPATACGGDWWSFFVVREESVAVFVGDITGHGPGSAMMTASVASYLKALRSSSTTKSTAELLNEVNLYLLDLQKSVDASDRYLMTMCAVELNLKTRTLKLWSAGAPFPILIQKSGGTQALGNSGHPLGLSEKLSLGYEEVQTMAGDRLFLYTDGIPEMRIAEERQLGDRRLTKLIQQTRSYEPQKTVLEIEKELDRQKFGDAQEDDFTYVVLDVH